MNRLEKDLLSLIKNSQDLDFPGLKVSAFKKGKNIARVKWGKTYNYYDIASLTKIVFTAVWYMEAQSLNKVTLNQKVSSLLPWYQFKKVTVGKLLNHSAGNKWWKPFYKDISLALEPSQAYQQMEKLCQKAPLEDDGKSVYSDIDFYLLGSIMQKVDQMPLIEIWNRIKEDYFPNSHFHFNSRNQSQFAKTQYAPTEKCSFRGRTMQGQVHDENCWALGGIAPHAGLFGRIDDLELYGQFVRKLYLGKKVKNISPKTFKLFTKRSLPKNIGNWGYGYMLPSAKGSSAGDYFSKTSFGHTGFTGMSFWFDDKRDLFLCVMSNRVHPTRDNKGFVRLRPKIHNGLIELLEGVQ